MTRRDLASSPRMTPGLCRPIFRCPFGDLRAVTHLIANGPLMIIIIIIINITILEFCSVYPAAQSAEQYKRNRTHIMYETENQFNMQLTDNVHINSGSNITDYMQQTHTRTHTHARTHTHERARTHARTPPRGDGPEKKLRQTDSWQGSL